MSPCLFNLHAENILQNAGLTNWNQDSQTGIKIAGRNINNLRYVEDTTLNGRSEEELKSFLMKAGHGTTYWFLIGKGVCQGCILSPCLFNLYAEYIMRNAGLEETQAGIKIARRNNLRYAEDTTLMAENEEELKSLLMKVKVKRKKLA